MLCQRKLYPIYKSRGGTVWLGFRAEPVASTKPNHTVTGPQSFLYFLDASLRWHDSLLNKTLSILCYLINNKAKLREEEMLSYPKLKQESVEQVELANAQRELSDIEAKAKIFLSLAYGLIALSRQMLDKQQYGQEILAFEKRLAPLKALLEKNEGSPLSSISQIEEKAKLIERQIKNCMGDYLNLEFYLKQHNNNDSASLTKTVNASDTSNSSPAKTASSSHHALQKPDFLKRIASVDVTKIERNRRPILLGGAIFLGASLAILVVLVAGGPAGFLALGGLLGCSGDAAIGLGIVIAGMGGAGATYTGYRIVRCVTNKQDPILDLEEKISAAPPPSPTSPLPKDNEKGHKKHKKEEQPLPQLSQISRRAPSPSVDVGRVSLSHSVLYTVHQPADSDLKPNAVPSNKKRVRFLLSQT